MSASPARLRLAANARQRRKMLGLSQEELGDRASIHRTYIGEIERGTANVTVDHMQKLADALNLDVSALLSPLDDSR